MFVPCKRIYSALCSAMCNWDLIVNKVEGHKNICCFLRVILLLSILYVYDAKQVHNQI